MRYNILKKMFYISGFLALAGILLLKSRNYSIDLIVWFGFGLLFINSFLVEILEEIEYETLYGKE